MERCAFIHRDWYFGQGTFDLNRYRQGDSCRKVDLPHDYMIENDTFPQAPSGAAGAYYHAGVAHYVKELPIPSEWEGERIFLRLDGAMMNATVEVNGARAALRHYGYAPFETEITQLVYPGKSSRIVITLNPTMQPNSRWYSGAGLLRSAALVHTPVLRIAFGGLAGFTKKIEYAPDGSAQTAFLSLAAEVENGYAENRVADVRFSLIREAGGETVGSCRARIQVPAMGRGTARAALTVDGPELWSAPDPALYLLRAEVTSVAVYRTHMEPVEHPSSDREEVLFGIRTVETDVRHGLRINGQPVKLRGGCLHHDNGVIGAVSLYDAEARKIRILKGIGFNAVRTTHNPPSAALIEACDRLGMYVFDEAFDAWGMGKQPGDYSQYFDNDWERDLTDFVCRDRCHPSVIMWSTGNEITERAGLNDGYVLAAKLADAVRRLDPSRPVSNAICSFWNGLDDDLKDEDALKWDHPEDAGAQNAVLKDGKDLSWEERTEAFADALDVVGYNYLEHKYEQDHALYPERVILGSENYPKEIGIHWPMIEKTPWLIGDFTWTAWDYLGEAGIGRAVFLDRDDPRVRTGVTSWGLGSPYPWRAANDADVDLTGAVRPQGVYRRIVWGSGETGLFAYDPACHDKTEVLTAWGFPDVKKSWNWPGAEEKPVTVAVFSMAEEAELFLNGVSQGRIRAGEALLHGMPGTFAFESAYVPGVLEAVSYSQNAEVSRTVLVTAGAAETIRLEPETPFLRADGESLCYVRVRVTDSKGNTVPSARVSLTARVTGKARLLGFGSGAAVTPENYTSGCFACEAGEALAVLRAGHEEGEACLTVTGEGLGSVKIMLPVK